MARAAKRTNGLSSGEGEGEKPDAAKDAPKAIKEDMQMVPVPAGDATMGQDSVADESRADETPAHAVKLGAFRIDRYEVSNRQYAAFLDWIAKNPQKAHSHCHPEEPKEKDHTPLAWKAARFGGDPYPVVGVDWFDAWAYAHWARKRLPTEAEWERAARGTDGRTFPWGTTWDPLKCLCPEGLIKRPVVTDADWQGFEEWVRDTAPRLTAPVNAFPEGRSPCGAYNMAGNAAEWVLDWYDDRYYEECKASGTVKDPTGPVRGKLRVIRGGAWAARSTVLFETTNRLALDPLARKLWLGFRCAKEGEEK
jgi:formylglycine-generating enzyme required for sulfatase activity